MKLVSGTANLPLAQGISDYLGIGLTQTNFQRFRDQEIFIEILENVRGQDVFLIQPTSCPANDNLMELLVTIDALKRGSADRITAVIPYYGYARQDRKSSPRSPITAKLVANLIVGAGADRVLTMDLHASQIQGFFDVPTDNLYAGPTLTTDIRQSLGSGDQIMIVSPDVGGVVRARATAKRLGCDLAIVDKRRPKAGVSEVMNIIGDVQGKHCVLIDDIVDSGGTLCNAAQAIMDQGAKSVSAYISHGVFSDPAAELIANSAIRELVITDSIKPTDKIQAVKNIRHLSIAPLLGDAIRRIANNESVSDLFNETHEPEKK